MINQNYTGNEEIIDLIREFICLYNIKGPFIQSNTYRKLFETLEKLLKELKSIEEKSSNEVDERTSELEIIKQKYIDLKNRLELTNFIQDEEQKYISDNSEEEQKLSYFNTPQYRSLMREILNFQAELDNFIIKIKSLLIDRFSYVINTEDEENKDINPDITYNTQAIKPPEKERNNIVKKSKGFSLHTLWRDLFNKEIRKISKEKAYQLIEEMIGKTNVSEIPEIFNYIYRYDNYYSCEINGRRYVVLNGLSTLNDNKGDNCVICSDNQCILISNDNLNVRLYKVNLKKSHKNFLYMKMPLDENSEIYVHEESADANQKIEYDVVAQEDGSINVYSMNKKDYFMMFYNSIDDICNSGLPKELLIDSKDNGQTIFYKEDEGELYVKEKLNNKSDDSEDKRYSYEEVMKECKKICDESLVLSIDDLMLVHGFIVNGIRGAISYDDSLKILQEIQPNLAKLIREYRGHKRKREEKKEFLEGLHVGTDSTTKYNNSSSNASEVEIIPRKANGQRRPDFEKSLQANKMELDGTR